MFMALVVPMGGPNFCKTDFQANYKMLYILPLSIFHCRVVITTIPSSLLPISSSSHAISINTFPELRVFFCYFFWLLWEPYIVRMRNSVLVLAISLLLGTWVGANEAQMSYDYYKTSCPNAENIVRRELLGISLLDTTAPAAFLRLLFHDCQVQGCDASILLDAYGSRTESEMKSYRNFGIRKREAVEQMKSALEAECPGQVSCADIIAMAARESVSLSGGPRIGIPLGRKDSRTCSYQTANAYLPPPSISVNGFLQTFISKGMSLEESVAILGAHTLGVGHCLNIVKRLYNPSPTDRMNYLFQAQLRLKCPTTIPLENVTFVSNDITPGIFDNHYFIGLLMGRGLFQIDASLASDPRTLPIVRSFASDQNYFYQMFSSAFVKLSSTNVLNSARGEVRRQCSRAN